MIMNKSLTYSVILFLSGVFLLNIMGLLIKHLELTYSPYQISVYRNIFGIIPIIIIRLLIEIGLWSGFICK